MKVWRCGKREVIHLSLHSHRQNDPCIKMGSDESHFNVSLIARDSHKTVSTNYDLFKGKGLPKREIRPSRPLTSLTPHHWAKPAHDPSENSKHGA